MEEECGYTAQREDQAGARDSVSHSYLLGVASADSTMTLTRVRLSEDRSGASSTSRSDHTLRGSYVVDRLLGTVRA